MQTARFVNMFLTSCRGKGLATDTLRWYTGILQHFSSKFPNLPIRPSQIERYLANLDCGDERRLGYYRSIHALYRYLYRRRKIRTNPMELMDPPSRKRKLPHYLTADHLDQLLRFPHSSKIKACLLFLADTGCRVGELDSLKQNSFTETPEGWIALIDGKTGQRQVPICRETATAINKCVPLGWSRYYTRRQIAKAFIAAHVPGSGSWLRHTFGTLWSGDLMELQLILGHSKPATTEIYRHLRIEHLCEAHSQHSPLKKILTATIRML